MSIFSVQRPTGHGTSVYILSSTSTWCDQLSQVVTGPPDDREKTDVPCKSRRAQGKLTAQ